MFNGVLLVAIIATWILKVTSLPNIKKSAQLNFCYMVSLLDTAAEKVLNQKGTKLLLKTITG